MNTLQILQQLQPGVYAVDNQHNISPATEYDIKTKAGYAGIRIIDQSVKYMIQTKYIPVKLSNENPKFKTIDDIFQLASIPDMHIYKGMYDIKTYRKGASGGSNDNLSFYTTSQLFASLYAQQSMLGKIYAFKVKSHRAFIINNNNIRILQRILSNYPDKYLGKRLSKYLSLITPGDPIQKIFDYTYVVGKISDCAVFNLRHIKDITEYVDAQHTPSIDRTIGQIILQIGKSFGFDSILSPGGDYIYHTKHIPADIGHEFIMYRDSQLVSRDTSNPVDCHNWPKQNIPNLHMRQLNMWSIDRILDWYNNSHPNFQPHPHKGTRIMSFNVHMFLAPDKSQNLRKHLADIINYYKPDIVFLQEFPINDKYNIHGYTKFTQYNMCAMYKGKYTAKYTVFPIYKKLNYNVENKGYITLTGYGKKIISLHCSIYTDMDTILRKHERDIVYAESADIICGDFNEIAADIDLPGYCSNLPQTTPFNAVDHFYSKHKANYWTFKTNYSDHYPIFMDY